MEDHPDVKFELLGGCPRCQNEVHLNNHPPHRRRMYWILSLSFHLTLLTLAVFFLDAGKQLYVQHKQSIASSTPSDSNDHDAHIVGTTEAPLNHHEQFTMQATGFDYWNYDLYFGEPNWASDEAWNKLIYPRTFRLHPNEAKRLNMSDSMRLAPDGEDFGSILGVIHNLHCIRRLRQSFYNDYYYANTSKAELAYNRVHAFHCLESLRTSILCYPDLNPYSYYWSDQIYHPIAVSGKVTRQCVDWEALGRRVESRMFPIEDLMENTGPGFTT